MNKINYVYICPRCGFTYHLHPGGIVEGQVEKEEKVAAKLSGKWRCLICWKCEKKVEPETERRIIHSIRQWMTSVRREE